MNTDNLDKESWYHRFVKTYEKRRKTINENLGLIIALVASAAAIYSGWVAEKARTDASKAADQSLALQRNALEEQRKQAQDSMAIQQRSVDAQIQATRLDERPYVIVDFDHIELCPGNCNADEAYVKLKVVGRTPALDVRFDIRCSETIEPDRKAAKAFSFSPRSSVVGVLPVDQPLVPGSAFCYTKPKHSGDREAWLYGVIEYRDIFQIDHSTTFCFQLTPTPQNPKDWDVCDGFPSKLT